MNSIAGGVRTWTGFKVLGGWKRLVPFVARYGHVAREEHWGEYRRVMQLLKPVTTEHELIRLGGDGDGGYLIPDDLDGIAACFAPGVGYITRFDDALLERGIRVFQIDASVEDTPTRHPLNTFERKFLGARTHENVITLDDWIAEKLPGSTDDLLLEIDIEGHEWLALAQVSDATLSRFRMIVAEFHMLSHLLDGMTPVFEPVLRRLADQFDVLHVHPNNGGGRTLASEGEAIDVFEVTYLRKDRSKQRKPGAPLPHPLDQNNAPHLPTMPIPSYLFS